MKIVFMGTPKFSVPVLSRLIDDGHEIVGVFTQPDKPKGRGYTLMPSPMKEFAVAHCLEVYQPETLRSSEVQRQICDISPDIIVVVAYGKILPKEVLEIPKYGCVNVHASLLPELRGAAPIQQAIIEGRTKTGITIMEMGEGLDTGDMLLKREVEIGDEETSGELFERLAPIGAELLSETLVMIKNGTVKPEKKDDIKSSYASMISKDMCRIDWGRSAHDIHNLVRGLTPFLTANTTTNGKKLKIHRISVADGINVSGKKAGEVVIENKKPYVVCGEGAVELIEVQLEGKKRVNACDFIRGYKLELLV